MSLGSSKPSYAEMSRDKEQDEISSIGDSGKRVERGGVARAGSPRVPFRSAAGRARLGESNLSWTVQNSGAFSSLLLMDIVSVVYGYIPGIKQSAWHKDSLTTSLLKKPKMLLEMSTLP